MKSINMMNQSMIDEFEVEGLWYKPSTPEYKVHGKLLYSHKEATLNLFGSLNDDVNDLSGFNDTFRTFETIYGETLEGEFVTLFNIHQTSSVARFSGYDSESYVFNFFIVGGHFANHDELVFNEACFNSTYLESFMNEKTFSVEREMDNNNFRKSTSVAYNYPDIQEWHIANLNASLKTDSVFTIKRSIKNVDMHYKARLKLVANTPQNYNWFKSRLYQLLDLFAIFTGEEHFFKELIFKSTNKEDSQEISYKIFFNQKDFKERKSLNRIESILLSEIHENFSDYLNNWYQLYDELESIYNLYINTKFNGTYENWKFLNYTRILEGYHRLRFTDSTYCEPSDYIKIKESIHEYVDTNLLDLNPELKKNIKNAVSYSYEYSFVKRLTEIAKDIDPLISQKIFKNNKDLKGFMYKVKETRNKMTHPQAHTSGVFEGINLYYANVRLSALIHSLILKDMGLPEEFIADKLFYLYYHLGTAKQKLN
ncbi:HEPN domain-containing protein [Bacillus thuringiensis]|uniref:ApeA N-terminal domain 1-containing protein n=1 Tax=Bacillus thuringiensis TaxID=1428 RepID=UPI000BF4BF75|nr:HEPN domain-containing protein [Bacillus thuringiensis]PES36706.1 hypothetical protein CN499_32400 [Bacillus thuringiensis]